MLIALLRFVCRSSKKNPSYGEASKDMQSYFFLTSRILVLCYDMILSGTPIRSHYAENIFWLFYPVCLLLKIVKYFQQNILGLFCEIWERHKLFVRKLFNHDGLMVPSFQMQVNLQTNYWRKLSKNHLDFPVRSVLKVKLAF